MWRDKRQLGLLIPALELPVGSVEAVRPTWQLNISLYPILPPPPEPSHVLSPRALFNEHPACYTLSLGPGNPVYNSPGRVTDFPKITP